MAEIEGSLVDVTKFEQQPPSSHQEYTDKALSFKLWAESEEGIYWLNYKGECEEETSCENCESYSLSSDSSPLYSPLSLTDSETGCSGE